MQLLTLTPDHRLRFRCSNAAPRSISQRVPRDTRSSVVAPSLAPAKVYRLDVTTALAYGTV